MHSTSSAVHSQAEGGRRLQAAKRGSAVPPTTTAAAPGRRASRRGRSAVEEVEEQALPELGEGEEEEEYMASEDSGSGVVACYPPWLCLLYPGCKRRLRRARQTAGIW